MPVTPAWLTRYYERGFRLIFYQSHQKGPAGQEALQWTERSDQAEDWKDGRNVGVFTGHEMSPGHFLADVDFDWTDGIPLSKRLIPKTGFGFGRESRTISHAFFATPQPLLSQSFENIDGKPFVELRGTKQDGTVGFQTMLPPSIHPNGEQVVIRMDDEIPLVDDLPHTVALYAIACILFAHLGHRGLLHDTRLAVAGFLLGEGLTEEEAIKIGEAIAEASGNNVADVKITVRTTVAKIKHGEHVYGKSALLKAIGDQDGRKVISRIKEWLGGGEFLENSKGVILASSQENVKMGLDKIGFQLSFDAFAQKALVEPNGNGARDPLVDHLIDHAWLEIDTKYHFRAPKDFFYTVVNNIAYGNTFHPVLDYLSVLKWDGIPRLDEWIIRSGRAVDTPYVRAVSAIVLMAAVHRVTTPGCKYDEMVVLESETQGLLKSTALRTLCPNEAWFSDDLPLNVDAKQIVERTLGKWIIEASDLSGMRVSMVEHLKGMLSRQVDGPVRLAYARLPTEQPRQFVIIGTTNAKTYLTDNTGNRRFWPIAVRQFDIPWITENRDQLWAEAYAREQAGTSIRLNPGLYELATEQQESRREEDPWEDLLRMTYPESKKHRVSTDDVWKVLGVAIERRDLRLGKRLGSAMKAIGFRYTNIGGNVKGYIRDVVKGQIGINDEDHVS